jgi:hypothetical protein
MRFGISPSGGIPQCAGLTCHWQISLTRNMKKISGVIMLPQRNFGVEFLLRAKPH